MKRTPLLFAMLMLLLSLFTPALGESDPAAEDAAPVRGPSAPVDFLLLPQSAEVELPPFTVPEGVWRNTPELLRPGTPPYQSTTAPAALPLLGWPTTRLIDDRNILFNYPDDDATSALKDYEGLTHTQNGRSGTDVLLFNFREMDRGFPVIAAAEGSVSASVYDKVDRTIGAPFPDDGNYVWIRHGSANEHTVYHNLRTNSNTVEVGDTVHVGDTIGLIGSSGQTGEINLFFGAGEFTPSFVYQDPWNGAFNTAPSLWTAQQPYIGSDPLKIWDLTYTTQTAAGGDVFNTPDQLRKEGFSQPDTLGAAEPYVFISMFLQGQSTDAWTLRVRRPDNLVYGSIDNQVLGVKRRALRQFVVIPWGSIPPGLYGTWSIEVEVSSVIVAQTSFEVNATTSFGPRCYPLEGRSVRLTGLEQRDTLRIQSLGGPVTYGLVNAPSFVSLVNDSIVVFDAVSNTTMRSTYFQAVATDAGGRVDTFFYHIVDPSRPWKCFTDSDGDGYGDVAASGTTGVTDVFGICLPGTADSNDDCDDGDAAINPGATEVCDGVDNNCDGQTDEGVTTTYYLDSDGDGFGDPATDSLACSTPVGYVGNSLDCDDGDAGVNPGATEVCDGVDNNCDGQTDEGLTTAYYLDADGDGFGRADSSVQACSLPGGYAENNIDCDDTDSGANPGATEVCDGVDNNCDGQTDEGVLSTYYEDADGDGFGSTAVSQQACSAPPGYVAANGDCDDGDSGTYPGAVEYCNGVDNDCNTLIDDNCITLCPIVITGDVDTSGALTSADIIGLVNYTFKGGADPLPCKWSADVNCSESVTSSDIIYLVNHVFKGGQAPCDICTLVPVTLSCP